MKIMPNTCPLRLKLMAAVLVALLVTACSSARDPDELSPEERNTAISAANTTQVVANDPALAAAFQHHANILLDQAAKIWNAVQASPEEKAAPPAVSPKELQENPERAAEASSQDRQEREEELKKAREDGRWWGFLAGLGTLLGTTVLPRVLTSLGIPGGGLLASGIEWLAGNQSKKKAQELDHRASTAATAVASSSLGKLALRELDKRITDGGREEIAKVVGPLTGGEATTIEGLFKFVAKGNNVDQGKERDVSALLAELGDLMDTEGGAPAALGKLLKKN